MKKLSNLDVLDTDAFTLSGRVSAPEIYADGYSQLLLGFPTTKIVFHSLVEPKTEVDSKEERRVVATLSISTLDAILLATTILAGCKSSEGQLGLGADQYLTRLKATIAQIGEIKMPPGADPK
jgi:hypothetical protein